MGIFSKSGQESELVALFDLSSSSVGGALVFLHHGGSPQIVFSVRESIAPKSKFNFDEFLQTTLKALDSVAAKLSRSGKGAPKRLFCVLASPWYGSETRIIRFSQKEPFVFTNKFADGLIEKEVEAFKKDNADKYPDFHSRMLPVELKNMKTILNGYSAANPVGQRAQELEMTLFIAMSSEEFLTKVQEVTVRHFHREEIKFSSFAFSSFAVARDLFLSTDNFLLVDVSGELTDISMVKNDALLTSYSFPIGFNFMIREIASYARIPLEEASSLFSLWKASHMSPEVEKKLTPIMEKLKSDWLAGFQNALANLSHDISIPHTIFLTVESEYSGFFDTLIKMEQFSQYTLSESKFSVVLLSTQELHGKVALGQDVARDSFLMLESIYINHFLR